MMIDFWLKLLGWQLFGTALVHFLQVPVPGPVVGLLCLTVQLLLRPAVEQDNLKAETLVQYLPVLFVPACVGVSRYTGYLADSWWQVLIILLLSTALSLVLTAWVFCRLARRFNPVDQSDRQS